MKWVECRENVRAFCPKGQSKLSVITRCPSLVGVNKAVFDCTLKSLLSGHISPSCEAKVVA